MAGSGEFFWEYSMLPPEVQGNVMRQMDREALKSMRAVSKGSRDLVDIELKRRRPIFMKYLARIGEMPSKWMSLEEIIAANKMRVVEALTKRDFKRALTVLAESGLDGEVAEGEGEQVLLKIPLGSVSIPESAFEDFPDGIRDLKVKIGHVHFPAGLMVVGAKAFLGSYTPISGHRRPLEGCRLYFPDSLERIDESAFGYVDLWHPRKRPNSLDVCAGQMLHLPRNLKHLGNWAFSRSNMKGVIFAEHAPAGIMSFPDLPFIDCTELHYVEVPATASIDCFPEKSVRRSGVVLDYVETVACTNAFWVKHKSKFPKTAKHIVIPSAGGGAVAVAAAAAASGEDGVAGRMKRLAKAIPKRPNDLATTTTPIESTV